MVSLAQANLNLFTTELTDAEKLREIAHIANCSQSNKAEMLNQIEQNKSNKLAAGIGYCLIGMYSQAAELLEKCSDSREKCCYLGLTYRCLGQYDKALQQFDEMKKQGADELTVCLEKAETLRKKDDIDAAVKELEKVDRFADVSAEYHYQKARVLDEQGEYEQAMTEYEKAVEIDPAHTKAVFHLALAYDLKGDEQIALEYYKQIKNSSPVYVNALLNMSVIYEDTGEYERALSCVNMVLACHPNHQKALMFKKDIESSMYMIYDEEKEKQKSRQSQLLNIPISDFELSVRSRNCLKKMNIKTLGDLLKISESELLSYKNFGETSLMEIKGILEQKGLTLGMSLEGETTAKPVMPDIEGVDEEILKKSIDDLELSVRARKCLSKLCIRTVGELVMKTEAELLGCKNFGVTSLNEIKDRLTALGLHLKKLE